jgi:PKD repeat protein
MDFKCTHLPNSYCYDEDLTTQGVAYPFVGNGVDTEFGLLKAYQNPIEAPRYREIVAVEAGSFLPYINGVATPAGWTLDYDKGILVFDDPPAPGSVITHDCFFDLWVRFDVDAISVEIIEPNEKAKVASLQVTEVVLRNTLTLAPPIADFTFASAGTGSLTIDFTDDSAGGPTSWSWAFGDGTTSTLQNPTKAYLSAGVYTVTLTATNAGGSDSQSYAVTVLPALSNELVFNGVNQYVVLRDVVPYVYWRPTFRIKARFKMPTGTTGRRALYAENSGLGVILCLWYDGTSGTIGFYRNGGISLDQFCMTAFVPDSIYHTLEATYTPNGAGGNTAKLYLDGFLVNTVTFSSNAGLTPPSISELGRFSNPGGPDYWIGSIAYVQINDAIPSDAQILAQKCQIPSASDPTLIAAWLFSEGSGTSAVGIGSESNTALLVGGVTWGNSSSCAVGATLDWVSNGDTNGLFYYLGSQGGTVAWTNPLSSANVVASSNYNDGVEFISPQNVADRAGVGWASDDFADSWIAFDLGAGREFIVSDYTLRSRSANPFVLPRNWRLEGTNSVGTWDVTGVGLAAWTTIQAEIDNAGLSGPDTWLRIVLATTPVAYRYLRLFQYGASSTPGFGYFTLGEVEFYGQTNW